MKGKIARRLARYLERFDADISSTQGIVTFTFDDAYWAACNLGATIIERAGGRATYYVCGSFDQSVSGSAKYHKAEDLRRLQAGGHEIACHGFGHLNYQETQSAEIQRDLDLNAAYFRDSRLEPARNFAYPYGCVSPRVKRLCATRFRSSRGVESAVNRRRVDLSLLKSVPLYSSTLQEPDVTALIEQTRDTGGWLIFFGHDVSDKPEWFDMTPRLLEHAVSEVGRCSLPILTLDAALDRYGL